MTEYSGSSTIKESGPVSSVLSDAESRAIFKTDIMPAELSHLQRPSRGGEAQMPLAAFVLGQTGAGKTRTAPALKETMRSRGAEPAHFIADTYKAYHPEYARLAAELPAQASWVTGPDARRWLVMAVRHAIDLAVDVLLELACRYPGDFAELAQAFHDAGYRVEVTIMAVPAGLSRLGILVRFYERLPEAGSGNLPIRLTPSRVHDDSYRGLLEAAMAVDDSTSVDSIVLVRRGDAVVYANKRVAGAWEHPRMATEVLRKERQCPLRESERRAAVSDLARLGDRGIAELSAQLSEVAALLEPLLTSSSGPEPSPGIVN